MACFCCGATRPNTVDCSSASARSPDGLGQVAGVDRFADHRQACSSGDRRNRVRVVAGDHLERHLLFSEVGQDLRSVRADLVFEFDDRQGRGIRGKAAIDGPSGDVTTANSR